LSAVLPVSHTASRSGFQDFSGAETGGLPELAGRHIRDVVSIV